MTPKQELALIDKAQSLAPSYLEMHDDGAPTTCDECGFRGSMTNFVLTFTPNKAPHKLVHRECIDEWWFTNAKNAGEL